jgi:general secretion pathway protein L
VDLPDPPDGRELNSVAGPFLMLDMTARGMTAVLVGSGVSGTPATEPVSVPLEGLPDVSGDGRLQAAVDAVAATLDLSGCTEAVVFISCQQVCFRNVSLPFDSPGKIAQVLPLELASHLPWDDVVSDFLVQEVRFVADQHLVLTASAPRDLITGIVACLRPFKIRPRMITPKGYALAAAHLQTGSPFSDQIFIHLGPSDITLTLIAGSKPVMVRTLTASDRIADTVADNVIRLITGFRQRSGLDTRFHVCLAPESSAPDPAQVMEKLRQVPGSGSLIDAGDPEVLAGDLVSAAGRLYHAPGRSFNFSRHAHGWEAFFHKYRFELATTAVIGALVLVLSVTGLYRQISVLEARVASARQAGADLYAQTFPEDPVLPGYSPLLLMQAKMKQKQQQQGAGTGRWELTRPSDIRAIDVLSELSARIPAGKTLQLSRLLLNHGQATVSGTTDSFNTVDRLKTALEQSPMFKTVTITTADADRTGNQVIFQFRIEM